MPKREIPFFTLERQHAKLKAEIDAAIARVFKSSIFIGGPEVTGFEEAFSAWVVAKHGISVASGFDALTLSLKALGIGPGDEVITASNGCPATPLAIAASGAKPVFVDCDDNYLIDTRLIEKAITRRSRAILPVHLYGLPADMTAIMRIARKHNLSVVEDCAQAHGSLFRGKKVGVFGDFGCFSFYPTKNLGAAGDAGMAVTSKAALAAKVRRLSRYGEVSRFDSIIPGVNSRLDPIQAAILSVKLKHLDRFVKRRREIAAIYIEELKNADIITPHDIPGRTHSYHLFVVKTPKRDKLRKMLLDAGIDCDAHYPIPNHMLGAFVELGYKRGDFPMAEQLAKRILSLPLYPELTDEEAITVAREVKQALAD